jgi:hypothetical protein
MSTILNGHSQNEARQSSRGGGLPAASEHSGGERSDLLFAYGMFFAQSRGHSMPGWASSCARGAYAGLVAVATATTLAQVDLTPIPSSYEVEGARFANVTFQGWPG